MKFHWAVIALAGPPRLIQGMNKMDGIIQYDSIHLFEVPDDAGEFPDTTGYQSDRWEEIESNVEDPFLWKYMQKCMDCVLDKTDPKMKFLAEHMGYRDVERSIHWPKEGGKIFFVTGHVTGYPPIEEL